MKFSLRSIVTLGSALPAMAALGAAAQAATVFDTTPSWNGSSFVSSFGNPNTATYGQTFVAPSDSTLDSFTFYVNAEGNTLQFTPYVFQWTGSLLGGGGGTAIGSPLYSGSSMAVNGSAFVPVTINTGGVALTPGQQYVALFTVSNPSDYAATTGTGVFGDTQLTHVANDGGGGFVFDNNGNNFAALNTSTWDNFADFGDVAWTATFSASAVPEPGSVAFMMMSGLTGVGLLARRRRK